MVAWGRMAVRAATAAVAATVAAVGTAVAETAVRARPAG
jgi:hypothetical protein